MVGPAMQKEKASLRCNRDTDFICDFQTIATFKTLFGEKNLDVAKKLGPIPGRKPVEKRNVALDRRQPVFWKKLSPKPAPSAFSEES